MSMQHGTRPGTKPTDRYQGWDHIQGKGPEWKELHDDNRKYQGFESAVANAAADAEKAVIAFEIAGCMLHGGHVEKGAMAKAGVSKDMTPAQVLNHAQNLLPRDVSKRALGL